MARHIIEVAKTRVVIENGKVVDVAEPVTKYCPLRESLYSANKETRGSIRRTVERNIRKYGMFTPHRAVESVSLEVLFGASEMFYCALKNKTIDAAVIVCEGAGTVITDKPEIAQGIGIHLTGIISTEAIPVLIKRLRSKGCYVLSDSALIDQVSGVKKAIELGFKRIAVTLAKGGVKDIPRIRALENRGVEIAIFIVHTTGTSKKEAELIADNADVAWGCASRYVRKICGEQAVMQIGVKIPVFVLTRKGRKIVLDRIKELDSEEKILISRASSLPVEGESPRPLR